MPTTNSHLVLSGSSAETVAARCWSSNLLALRDTQPRLLHVIESLPAGVEWVFARDATLTALDHGQWLAGCSLPLLAARQLLKKLDVRGTVACFLSPTHAAQLRVALDKLQRAQAIVVLVPELRDLRLMLQCQDFSMDLQQHRLYFVWGESWTREMTALFEDNPGLSLPTQFIRLPILAQEQADPLIQLAQELISSETQRRSRQLAELQRRWTPRSAGRRLCVVAPSAFRLWEEAPLALGQALRGFASSAKSAPHRLFEIHPFDPDDPASASPLGLAQAAAECDAFFCADKARGDFPPLLPSQMPWITWVTAGHVPPFTSAGPRDRLLLADPRWRPPALAMGWPADRLHDAPWPRRAMPATAAGGPRTLLVLADTRPATLQTPLDLSSHQLLWDAIAKELGEDPFVLGEDLGRYLAERMARFDISDEGLDRRLFLEHLIVPAYQQALVRLLLDARLPLRIYGEGWDGLPEFHPHYSGCLTSRQQFLDLLQPGLVLVHLWPWLHAHAMDASGLPVLRRSGRRKESFLRAARDLLNDGATDDQPRVSWDELLGRVLAG